MKPAQIRVFDGLRLTTDHVNHLQGAFTSGLEDFRQILGLGKPQSGLEVSVQDNGAVTIQPGVAFDFDKNRLACDDPLNLQLAFGPQDHTKFICLKYEQVEDGAVEGNPTMVWDSCSALVRDALPDPKENLVPLARVVRDAEGKLYVHRPCECERPELEAVRIIERPGAPAAAASAVAATGSAAAATSAAGSAPAPALTPPAGAPPASNAAAAPAPSPAAAPVSDAAAVPAPAPPVLAAMPAAQLVARQGTVQVASDASAGSYMRTVVAPALRKKMGSGPIQLSFTLGQTFFAPGIRVSGFEAHCVLTGDLQFPAADNAPAPQHHFECVAHGEAVPADSALSQFSACQSSMRPVPATPGALWSGAEFAMGAVAQFSFGLWSAAPDISRPPFPADVLAGFQAVAQLSPADNGFQVSFRLLWSGAIAEASLQGLETQEIGFTWQILLGWKAIGY